MRELAKAFNAMLSEELASIIAERDRELGYNADSFADRLKRLVESLTLAKVIGESALVNYLPQLAQQIQGFNLLQQNKAAKAVLGIDIFKPDPKLAPLVESWAAENAKLIGSVGQGYVDRVSTIVQSGVRGGQSSATVAQQVREATGVSERKATLIARTEVAKLNSNITQHRQRMVGIDFYEWSASQDERVRDSHAIMDGRLCRWDDATVYSPDNGKTWVSRGSGEMLHPGEAILCRCVSYPVFPDELDA